MREEQDPKLERSAEVKVRMTSVVIEALGVMTLENLRGSLQDVFPGKIVSETAQTLPRTLKM